MPTSTLPIEASTFACTFTDPAALHALLARVRATDPLPHIIAHDVAPFWLVGRDADIMEVEHSAARFIEGSLVGGVGYLPVRYRLA